MRKNVAQITQIILYKEEFFMKIAVYFTYGDVLIFEDVKDSRKFSGMLLTRLVNSVRGYTLISTVLR